MNTPTTEQAAATEAFSTGAHLVIQAGAGTGKTTTLAMLARSARRQGRSGRYIAFNRAVARHAARSLPAKVPCGTAHALAYTAVGRRFQARRNSPRQAGWRTGAALGIDDGMRVRLGERTLTNKALSHAALRTVTRFYRSADPEVASRHVPPLRGAEPAPLHTFLAELVLPYARKAWADLQQEDHGVVRFEHDHYLKMWALSEPVIPADFLLLDEEQDTIPVVEQVVTAQRDHAQRDHAQLVMGRRLRPGHIRLARRTGRHDGVRRETAQPLPLVRGRHPAPGPDRPRRGTSGLCRGDPCPLTARHRRAVLDQRPPRWRPTPRRRGSRRAGIGRQSATDEKRRRKVVTDGSIGRTLEKGDGC